MNRLEHVYISPEELWLSIKEYVTEVRSIKKIYEAQGLCPWISKQLHDLIKMKKFLCKKV